MAKCIAAYTFGTSRWGVDDAERTKRPYDNKRLRTRARSNSEYSILRMRITTSRRTRDLLTCDDLHLLISHRYETLW